MTAIPAWLIGVNATTVNIIGQTIAANGTLTPGATTSLVGQLDEIEIDITNETENITPMDVRQNNYVIVGEDATITLTEILKRSGTNILAALSSSYDVAQFNLTRGAQSWSFYGTIGGYNEGLRRGKSVGRMPLKIVNIAGANPAYS